MNISFSVKDDILLSLRENAQDFTQHMRFFAALHWYRKNKLSLGQAAELAGYSKLEFIDQMKAEKEPIFDYGENELIEIIADVAKLP
jgi:predicted HTH domain antitoxin